MTQATTTAPTDQTATPFSEFLAGGRDTFPLVVGAIPFGLIFGTLAIGSGLSVAGTSAMSAFVFAGSAQFIAVGLLAAGTSCRWPSGLPTKPLRSSSVATRRRLTPRTIAGTILARRC